MSQNIALTLTLGGTQVAVQNLDQLETAIRDAREQLRGLDIGSDQFKKLAGDIKLAEQRLKDFNKETEGKDLEARLGDFGKLGGAIGSTFAAATAAFALFGAESEETSKAVAQAQNLLTIALAARGAAEGAVVLKTVALNIATAAQTAATTAANVVTRTFYATLAANPYTALLAGVGLLIGALVAFTNQTEEAAEVTKTLSERQQESIASTVQETEKIKTLTTILKDNNNSLEVRRGAYAELQKQIPTLTNLTFEQASAEGVLNEYIADQILLIETRAKLKAVEDFIGEEEKKRVAEQVAALNNLAIARGTERQQLEQRLKLGGGSLEFINRELAAFDEQTKSIRESLNPRNQLLNLTKQVVEITDKQTQIINGQKKATDAAKESEGKRVETLRALYQAELELLKLRGQQFLAQEKVINQAGKFTDAEALIVKNLNERVNAQQGLVDSLKEFVPFEKTLSDVINPKQAFDEAKKGFDIFTGAIKGVFETIGNEGPLSVDFLQRSLNLLTGELQLTVDEFGKFLNPEAIKNLQEYAKNGETLAITFNKLSQVFGKGFNFNQYANEIAELVSQLDSVDPEVRRKAFQALQQEQEKFVQAYIANLKLEDQTYKNLVEEEKTANEDRKKELQGLITTQENLFQTAANAAFDNVKESVKNFKLFENGVVNVNSEVNRLVNLLKGTANTELTAFILANKELFAEDFNIGITGFDEDTLAQLDEEILSKRFDRFKRFQTDIEFLEANLKKAGIDLSQATYEEKLVLLQAFAQREVTETEKAENKKREETQKTIDFIVNAAQQVQMVLTSISQLTTDAYRNQFEALEREQKKIQEQIVGDTEQANQKRLEADKIYQEKRKEIEKNAARTALRISLAQAIANTAEAITKVAAQTGVLAIAATSIVAGINAAQVAQIAGQLNAIDSYQLGGRIKRRKGQQGFFVQGPDHGYGGVKFQNGGVELEGGEAVLSRSASLQYADLLSQVNQSAGGRPLVMNNFDDSRIVEAIAKQRNEPIRAFVVEGDITSKQTVTKRLEQLAQL
jgi:hypothetical protein